MNVHRSAQERSRKGDGRDWSHGHKTVHTRTHFIPTVTAGLKAEFLGDDAVPKRRIKLRSLSFSDGARDLYFMF